MIKILLYDSVRVMKDSKIDPGNYIEMLREGKVVQRKPEINGFMILQNAMQRQLGLPYQAISPTFRADEGT